MTNLATIVDTGRIDASGRLVRAGPALTLLQRVAGGQVGGPVAIAGIASVCRLAQSLRVLVSRRIVAVTDTQIADFLVEARPQGEDVEIALSDWKSAEDAPWEAGDDPSRDLDFAELESEGEWRCDAALVLSRCDADLLAAAGLPGPLAMGERLTRLVRLVEGPDGEMPLLDALAQRQPFAGQLAEMRADPRVRLTFHGRPQLTHDGRHAGFAGGYRILDRVVPGRATDRSIPAPGAQDSDLPARLDAALRQPIARIIANADQIGQQVSGPLRADYASYARDIAAAARHLLGLVDDLSDLQHVERGVAGVALEEIDIADIARRAAGLLRVRAADQGVRIDAPASDETLVARGDFRRVLQIMVNLLSNAVRYSPTGASIWIRIEQEDDLAVIVVADQGKGIAAEDQVRIFDKFVRIDPEERGGTGLGLYISRELARAMGGDLTVDSAPGQGARFMLTLPLAATA